MNFDYIIKYSIFLFGLFIKKFVDNLEVIHYFSYLAFIITIL